MIKPVTIERDWEQGSFIFRFPFVSDFRKPIYTLIGRLYVEMGEDDIVSYDVGLTEEDIFEIRIAANCETEEKEQRRLQEVLESEYEAIDFCRFSVCPLNFDLILTSSPWDKQDGRPTAHVTTVKAGETAIYSDQELKWKHQA